MFKKIIAASLMGLVLTAGFVEAKSRSSFSRSSFSSSKSFSSKKMAPAYKPATPSRSKVVSKPNSRSVVVSRPNTASKVFSKPTAPAITKSVRSIPTTRVVSTPKKPLSVKPSSTRVVKAPVRRVAPVVNKSKTVVIQKNYYGGYRPSYGYNRGYSYNRGYGYGGGYGGGSGFGSSFAGGMLGAMGGMMLYDALTDNQALTQTIDTVQQVGGDVVDSAQEQVQNVVPEGGFGLGQFVLPPDAPLMMDPSFYNQ